MILEVQNREAREREEQRGALFSAPVFCPTPLCSFLIQDTGADCCVMLSFAAQGRTRGAPLCSSLWRDSLFCPSKIIGKMREYTGGHELVRLAATLSATTFYILQSLHKNKEALRKLYVSDFWTKNKLAKMKPESTCMCMML